MLFYRSRLFLFSFILILFISKGFSQQVRNFSSITGKKDLGVSCIAQSKEGYLWMGCSEGLIRFDGKHPHIYKKEEGLSFNEVSALYLDQENTLWVGHKNGKISRVKKGLIDTFPLNNLMASEKITGFFSDAPNSLWIATYGAGVFHYAGNKLEHYTSENGLGDDLVYSIAFDGKQSLWLGTDAGLTVIDLKQADAKKRFSHITTRSGLPDNIVRVVKFDGKQNMLIAMQDSGMCYYNLEKAKLIKNTFLNSWSLGAITDVCEEPAGNLMIATEKNGILKIEKGKVKMLNTGFGLMSNDITRIFFDRESNLWVASQKGVSQVFDQRHSFITSLQGLPSDKISSMIVDEDNTIWAATPKGLSELMLDETGGYLAKNFFNENSGAIPQTVCMSRCPCRHLWVGTYGAGLIRFDSETRKSWFITTKNGLANDNVSSVSVDDDHHIWVATLGGGISKITEKGDQIAIHNYTEENGLGSSYVYQVLCDSKGRIWCANDGAGLELLEGDKFISISDKLKMTSKTAYSLAEDSKGNIWFTTSDEGLACYNGKTLSFMGTRNGLRDAQPQGLISAGDKIVTVHSKGIDVINSADKSVTYFDVSDNDIEPNLNAVFEDQEGNIWAGTNNGLLKFRALNTPRDTIAPAAFLTGMKLDFKDYSVDSIHEFGYSQNNFVFEFDAIWLKLPEKVKFRYKLEGQDNNWQQPTETKQAQFNNLSSGDYRFMVEACNEEGVWGKPAIYSFSISRPIWQYWWFWLITLVTATVVIYAFVKYRLKALQKENLILEKKVEERTAEIQEQSRIIEEKSKELEQLSLVASKTDNVVLIMDAEGRVEYLNDSFVRLNKITLEELKKTKGDSIYEISNNEYIHAIITDCREKRASVVYESLNLLEDGTQVWESSTLTPIYDDNGQLKKMIIIDTDVSERKRQEQIIVQKNKDILDSITYAKKIQTSILPALPVVKQSIPESFILYLTKDIVSGDFYWFADKEDFCIIAAIDCTGHGVPGAFMSLIGYNLLNQIVNEKQIHEPAKILKELNNGVLDALYKNQPNNQSKDGMDLAICKVYKNKKQLEFSGAMRPLWIVSKVEVTELKADKIPIGTKDADREGGVVYTNHVVEAGPDDRFYIFTDGYADQFGGEKEKKLTTGRFKEMLIEIGKLGMEEQRQKLLEYHKRWKGNIEQVDDILVIGMRL
ncbi:MAG: two-component regulator propeller domain-containing protein [Bacteroidia bacterium]